MVKRHTDLILAVFLTFVFFLIKSPLGGRVDTSVSKIDFCWFESGSGQIKFFFYKKGFKIIYFPEMDVFSNAQPNIMFFLASKWIWIPIQKLQLIGVLLYIFGVVGLVWNLKNFLISMLCIELTYLSGSFLLLVDGVYVLQPLNQLYVLLLILLAASDAAVGLGLLIVLYKAAKTIQLAVFYSLKN